MKKALQVALGIMTAVGGFIEIGDLVFLSQAGALFGYQLLWAVVLGILGIGVYAEMCGRIAATSGRAVFDLVRQRFGFATGAVGLLAGQLTVLLTLAAEIGGVALVLQLLLDLPARFLMVVAALGFLVLLWVMSFELIERVFGFGGLALLVFIVAALHLHPDWGGAAESLAPSWDATNSAQYGYFAVGIIAALFMPYEVYFYSSGGIEEGWKRPDLRLNKLTVIIGWGLGAILAAAIMVTAAEVFRPTGVQPELLGSVALGVEVPLGGAALMIVLIGMLFAIGGAVAETALAGAYNMAQFFGWEWGKYRRPRGAPRFTMAWVVMLLLGFLIVITGVNPITVTEFAVVFSVVVLPISYLPVLLVANDRTYMGDAVNGRLANILGWFYLGLITIVAIAAIPLLIATNMGQG